MESPNNEKLLNNIINEELKYMNIKEDDNFTK
jgi:hypothetical protein